MTHIHLFGAIDLSTDKNKLRELIKRPLIKDMSFKEMKDDLNDILFQIQDMFGALDVHLVGTCMGGLVASLYAIEHKECVKSLALFSSLFTFEPTFLTPSSDFAKNKRHVIENGEQFRMGNAVEGVKTYSGISEIHKYFYSEFAKLDIPVLAIQDIQDKLVPCEYQNKIFETFTNIRRINNLSPVHYAEIEPGVHCLYDVLFPTLMEVTDFIESNFYGQEKTR